MRPFRKQDPQDEQSNPQQEIRPRAEDEASAEIANLAEELEAWDGSRQQGPVPRRERGRAVASLAAVLTRGARAGATGLRQGLARGLADRLVTAAPRIPVRDLATLRAQHPDAESPEELADRLTQGAVRASATVGAGVGAFAMLPTPPAMPAEIAADALGAAAVELKLIAELYAVYGQPAPGTAAQRATAYLTAWTHRRGFDVTQPAGLAALTAGSSLKRELRRRLTRSTLRRVPSLTPLMIGAGVGAVVNRRETARLAAEIRKDLRRRAPLDPDYWAAARPS